MNRFQSSNAAAAGSSAGRTNIMVRPQKHVNRIVEKPCCDTCTVSADVLKISEFTVEEQGYYHISTQACVRNTSNKTHWVDFIQDGICPADMSKYEMQFTSALVGCDAAPAYVVSGGTCCIMELEKDTSYCFWVNFSSAKNEAFTLAKECCHVRLYKL